MANQLYKKAKENFLTGNIDWSSAVIRAVLVDTAVYTPDFDLDEAYDDLSGVVGSESPAFTGKTVALGVADAANITFSSVTGDSAEAIVIFVDTGTPATDLLIAYIDTATGLPVTPNSGDITVTWDVAGIFAL